MAQRKHSTETRSTARFDAENLEKLQRADEKLLEFKKSIKANPKLKEKAAALDVSNEDEFRLHWEALQVSRDAFDEKHQRGPAKIGREVTQLAVSAQDMLDQIKPVLDLVKDFGAPFGGMAIGAVCFLLTVARARATVEQRILITLGKIKDRLPGIKVYAGIYSDRHELDDQLQSQIIQVYQMFTEFCMAASEFYAGSSFERWFKSIVDPDEISKKEEAVHTAINDMRLTCEDLLSKSVHAGREEVMQLKRQNLTLIRQVAELQASNQKNSMEDIRRLLGVTVELLDPDDMPHANLEKHRRDVQAEFSRMNSDYGVSGEESSFSIEKDTQYQLWRDSSTSQVLVVSGVNMNPSAHHCWASLVGLRLIEKHANNDIHHSNQCVFYLIGLRQKDDTWAEVLSFLTYKLLDLVSHELGNQEKCRRLWSYLSSYDHARRLPQKTEDQVDDKTESMLEKLEKIALEVLGMFRPDQTVWIVLDRVEKCELINEARLERPRGGPLLLKTMARVAKKLQGAKNPTARLKVLAVVNQADWHVEDKAEELMEGGGVFVRTFRQSGERLAGDR